ncbi:MAG: YSC84-related protein [Candidatus Hydrogenedentales bacterium]
MKKSLALALAAALLMPFAAMAQQDREEAAEDRRDYMEEKQEIDTMVEDAMARLHEEVPEAKKLYDQAYGYAMFGVLKFALGVTGGGGGGVAVVKDSGERIYMNMGTGGLGLEIGGHKYNVLFLFEDEETFNDFVYNGWTAEASAEAVAGTEGVSAATSFKDGVAVYQFGEKGLIAGADVSGSKFWIDRELSPEAVAKQEEMEAEEEAREERAERAEEGVER